jgi:hypothetical protein
MYDLIEHVYKALGIESTWAFVLVVALSLGLIAALVGGFLGWVVDRSYKNSAEYKAEHSPKQQAATNNSSASNGAATTSDKAERDEEKTTIPQKTDVKHPHPLSARPSAESNQTPPQSSPPTYSVTNPSGSIVNQGSFVQAPQTINNYAPPARRLTDQEKAQLASLTNTPLDLMVWAHGEDKNAWNLGQDICLALRNAGWRIQHPECVEVMVGPPLGGNVDMAIFLNPVDIQQIDATKMRVHIPGVSQLLNILHSFGLTVAVAPSDKVPPKFVKLVMG